MSTKDHPAPDQIAGAPHPREALRLFGQTAAEQEFLDAFNSGRLHHGWLLTGPRGVGKATLAWRLARFLLATPTESGQGMFEALPVAQSLEVDHSDPVMRRIQAGAEPGLACITRSVDEKSDRMRDQIVVDDIRRLSRFFGLTSTDGGRRVVIVDCADDMNPNAANALLKMLEEPPARTTLLLVSHQPFRLLPTIRSRCRTLRLSKLSPSDLAAALSQAGVELAGQSAHLSELASGSAGDALRLMNLGGAELYAQLLAILDSLPRLDRPKALGLAEQIAPRSESARFELLISLIDVALSRLARTGVSGTPLAEAAPGEAAIMSRLAPNPPDGKHWADLAFSIRTRLQHGRAVNLDPAALVLDTVFKLQETAAG